MVVHCLSLYVGFDEAGTPAVEPPSPQSTLCPSGLMSFHRAESDPASNWGLAVLNCWIMQQLLDIPV